MSRGERRLGGRRTLIAGPSVLLIVWIVVVVAWPRLSLGAPLSRQVMMSTVPVGDGDGPRCWVWLVARWHDDRVNYYASTGCEGLDVDVVTVTVDGPDGHRDTSGCRDEDQLLLSCSARELEGAFHCGGQCAETTLSRPPRLVQAGHGHPVTPLKSEAPL